MTSTGGIQPPAGPAGPVGSGSGAQALPDANATVEQAWWLLMQRIGRHNPALYQQGGKALDSINNLMRMR